MLLGTPRYTPAWEKTSSIVPRALEEFEEWDEYEEEFDEGFDEFDELAEYLDNRRW